jgi:hypothetical protein
LQEVLFLLKELFMQQRSRLRTKFGEIASHGITQASAPAFAIRSNVCFFKRSLIALKTPGARTTKKWWPVYCWNAFERNLAL